jgi:hypothetical protein
MLTIAAVYQSDCARLLGVRGVRALLGVRRRRANADARGAAAARAGEERGETRARNVNVARVDRRERII